MKIFLLLILFFQPFICTSFNVVGWWVGNPNNGFSMKNLNWKAYTHIRFGNPLVYPNGTAFCNKTDYQFQNVLDLAHRHNVKVQWGPNVNVGDILWNSSMKYKRENYMNSIGTAVHECGVDGIEVDYEFQNGKYWKLGIISPKRATHYSHFLADIKKSIGPNKLVSADVSIWGFAPGNYFLGFLPWINATMLNRGDFDFINTMSYHWNKDGNLWSWKKDGWFIDKWGIDRKRVNIGIPYFSENRTKDLKIYNEPTWGGLSPSCPNINPYENVCKDIIFVGKKMNYELGKWIKKEGFRGVFPWAANYDSNAYNNSLIDWLHRGIKAK